MDRVQTINFSRLILELAGGTAFSLLFTKRTTGEKRLMVCRLGVKKGVKVEEGLGRAYDPVEKGLLTVYDLHKQAFRSVALEAVEWVKIRGRVYSGKEL